MTNDVLSIPLSEEGFSSFINALDVPSGEGASPTTSGGSPTDTDIPLSSYSPVFWLALSTLESRACKDQTFHNI